MGLFNKTETKIDKGIDKGELGEFKAFQKEKREREKQEQIQLEKDKLKEQQEDISVDDVNVVEEVGEKTIDSGENQANQDSGMDSINRLTEYIKTELENGVEQNTIILALDYWKNMLTIEIIKSEIKNG